MTINNDDDHNNNNNNHHHNNNNNNHNHNHHHHHHNNNNNNEDDDNYNALLSIRQVRLYLQWNIQFGCNIFNFLFEIFDADFFLLNAHLQKKDNRHPYSFAAVPRSTFNCCGKLYGKAIDSAHCAVEMTAKSQSFCDM